MDMGPLEDLPAINTGTPCDEDWNVFADSCYKTLTNNNQAYKDIEECR